MTNVKPIEEILSRYLEFSKTIDWNQKPIELYDPVKYIMDQQGKKLRPLSLMLISALTDAPLDVAAKAGYAIELFHNFTLAHDDIMDDAPLRRGKETMYKKYGQNSSILSGDVMLIESLRMMYEVEIATNKKDIVSTFVQAAREICEGQTMDMAFEQREDVSLEEYIEMIRLKTAVLIGCAMKIGAILGNTETEFQNQIYSIGETLGITFQIQDDWLDSYGDTSLVGKNANGDIIQRKKTALFLLALQKSNTMQKEKLLHLYDKKNNSDDRTKSTLSLFSDLEINSEIKTMIKSFEAKSLNAIHQLNLNDKAQSTLIEFINIIKNRNS